MRNEKFTSFEMQNVHAMKVENIIETKINRERGRERERDGDAVRMARFAYADNVFAKQNKYYSNCQMKMNARHIEREQIDSNVFRIERTSRIFFGCYS